jgi:hypothetical protein
MFFLASGTIGQFGFRLRMVRFGPKVAVTVGNSVLFHTKTGGSAVDASGWFRSRWVGSRYRQTQMQFKLFTKLPPCMPLTCPAAKKDELNQRSHRQAGLTAKAPQISRTVGKDSHTEVLPQMVAVECLHRVVRAVPRPQPLTEARATRRSLGATPAAALQQIPDHEPCG